MTARRELAEAEATTGSGLSGHELRAVLWRIRQARKTLDELEQLLSRAATMTAGGDAA
jgi:hypothetical protein